MRKLLSALGTCLLVVIVCAGLAAFLAFLVLMILLDVSRWGMYGPF